MTPAQHEKIDQLFHAALAIAPDQRDIWLEQVCEGDAELRRELESLLALSEEADTFIEVPFFKAAPEASAERQNQIITRKTKYCPRCQRQFPTDHRLCPQDGVILSLKDPYNLVGRTLAEKYRLDALVGVGGMGAVYCAHQARVNRRVAVKILLPALALANDHAISLFEREAQMAGGLSQENIAIVYDAGRTAEGVAYLVMEWLDGHTLEQELADSGPLELGRIADILRQIAAALDAAHAQRIIHRDLKPSNVMLIKRADGSEKVKVLDFGIAKALDNTLGSTVSQVIGTPHYASPEQLQPEEQINTRADIYSLGVILYQMLTGRLPFDAPSIRDLMQLHLSATPPSVCELRPEAPAAVERLVRRMLAKVPSQRPQRASEVAILFESSLSSSAGSQAGVDKSAVSDASTLSLGQEAQATKVRAVGDIAPTASSAASALITRAKKAGGYKLVGGALTLLVLVVAAAYFYRNRQPDLANKDTILLAEFQNKTGEEVFDKTLQQGLAIQLQQSPFLNIFPDARVQILLKIMNRSPEERVTRELGREISRRLGLKALVTGTIAKFDRNYSITLEALNGGTGEVIGLTQAEAEGKDQVLKALSQAAAELRGKLGESLASIRQFDKPLQEATSSIESLEAYSMGREQMLKGRYKEAAPFLHRAVELDPNFASAWGQLAALYAYINQVDRGQQYAEKAFALRDRLSEHDKISVTLNYHVFATGDVGKAIESLNYGKQTYPSAPNYSGSLAYQYYRIGQYEKAVAAAQEAIRLGLTPYGPRTLAFSLTKLNRYREAREVSERLIQETDDPRLHEVIYHIAFIEKDAGAMQLQLDWASGKPDEHVALKWQAESAAFTGQLRGAEDYSRRAIEIAMRSEVKGMAALYTAKQALLLPIRGSNSGLLSPDDKLKPQLRRLAEQTLALERGRDTVVHVALALALGGEVSQAQSLVDEFTKRYPQDTSINDIWSPAIRGALELQRGNAKAAIEQLQPKLRYEAASEFWQQYLRGLAYLNLNKPADAAVEFQ